eukprot:COSAG02_NODE_593_length_19851_cov_13.232736_5_plen_104_part_00
MRARRQIGAARVRADLAVILQVLDEFVHLAHVIVSTRLKGFAEDEGPQRHACVVDPQLIVDAAEKNSSQTDKSPVDLRLHNDRPQLFRELLDLLLIFQTHRGR